MDTKIWTDVDIKFFKERVRIETDSTIEDTEDRYIYQVSCKNTAYILKGYRIPLKFMHPREEHKAYEKAYEERLTRVDEVYQEFFLMRALSFFSPHIAKPLSLDCAIKEGKVIFVEMILESDGIPLSRLESVSVELAYSLMQQSVAALSLLHRCGVAHQDIGPTTMIYSSKSNVLKFLGLGSALNFKNEANLVEIPVDPRAGIKPIAPPEIVLLAKRSTVIPKVELDLPAVEVYGWAMSFCFVLLQRDNKQEEIMSEYGKRKIELEKGHNEFIKLLKDSLDSIGTKDPVYESIKSMLIDSLSYNPKERPSMKKIMNKLKKLKKNTAVKFLQAVSSHSERLKILLMFSNYDDAQEEEKKVSLYCGHEISKSYLIAFVLSCFFTKMPYEYSCYCAICGNTKKLINLTLDCGCIKRNLRKKAEAGESSSEADCEKCKKSMTPVDAGLVNGYISFESTCSMILDYQNKYSASRTMYYDIINEIKTLEWLLKNITAITKLDYCSKETSHEDAKAISKLFKLNKSLTSLKLYSENFAGEGIKTIVEAFKANTTLTELQYYEQGSTSEGVKSIAEVLKTNKTLRKVAVNTCPSECEGFELVLDALKGNKTLKELNIRHHAVRKIDLRHIVKVFRVNKTFTHVFLRGEHPVIPKQACEILGVSKTLTHLAITVNMMYDGEMKCIGEALRANRTLVSLNIGFNKIGDEGIKHIFTALEANQSLKKLQLKSSEKHEGAEHIGKALRANKLLMKLCLNSMNTAGNAIMPICEALKVNKTLAALSIKIDNLDDGSAELISEMLKVNRSLKKLKILGDAMASKNLKIIYEALKVNNIHIKCHFGYTFEAIIIAYFYESFKANRDALKVRYNPTSIDGLKFIQKMIESEKPFKSLDLTHGEIGSEGGKIVCEMIMANRALEVLKLSRNKMGYEATEMISKVLAFHTKLSVLELGGNEIGDQGAVLLGALFTNNKSLTLLDLSENGIGIDSAKVIGEELKVNNVLKLLNLDKNEIRDEGVEAICKSLRINTTLIGLNVNENKVGEKGKEMLEGIMLINTEISIMF